MSTAKISVCIPAYNSGKFISETIQSVLLQKFDDLEIIISDNASEDNTHEIISSYSDSRIKYFRNSRNLGLIENMNRCVLLSKGKYIRLLQADDVLLENALTLPMRILDERADVGMVLCAREFIDANRRVLGAKFPFPQGGVFNGKDLLAEILIRLDPIGSPSFVMIRRECFEKIGLFDPYIGATSELDMWMRIMVSWDVYYLDRILVLSRIHSGSHTLALVSSGKDIEEFFMSHQKMLKKKVINQHLNKFQIRSAFGLVGVLCWARFFSNFVRGELIRSWKVLKIALKNRSLFVNCIFFIVWAISHWSRIRCDLLSKHSFLLARSSVMER